MGIYKVLGNIEKVKLFTSISYNLYCAPHRQYLKVAMFALCTVFCKAVFSASSCSFSGLFISICPSWNVHTYVYFFSCVVLTCSVSSVMNSSGALAHSAGRVRVNSLLRHAGFPKNREVN